MFDAAELMRICSGKLLGNENAKCTSVTTDSRKVHEGDLFIALSGDNFDGNDFAASAFSKGAACCVVSREVQVPEGCAAVVVPDTKTALLEIAAYHRQRFKALVVGVTGSVGKTTTKEMISCALSSQLKVHKTAGNLNNEIGMPLTLLGLDDSFDAAVIEMGMSARGEISRLTRAAKPDVAVITNIGISHIEYLKTRENILAAKLEILEGLREGGTVLLNADDPYLVKLTDLPYKTIFFGLDTPCEVKGEVLSDNTVCILGEKITVSAPGRHNLLNACAAMAVARAMGLDAARAAKGIEGFVTDGIRQNVVKSDKGFTVICDWYNASPQSVSVALSLLAKSEGRKIAVLGDMLELGDYSKECHAQIGNEAAEKKIDILFTYGKESVETHDEALRLGCDAVHFDSKDELSAYLGKILQKDDTVLIKGSRGMKMEDIYEKIMG